MAFVYNQAMPKELTISVGIPAFNQGEYLEATILSLLEQRRPPDEIVISDHYSTDQTPDVIAKYAKHVRGVKPPPGVGVSGQWNYTFSCLNGDWVTLLSSDDLARPNYCEVLLRGAARRDDAVLVRAGWENADLNGNATSKEYLLSVKPVSLPPDNLLEQRNGPKASFAAFAVRRETLNKSGGYPVGMESFGDWPLFMQVAPYGSFIYEKELISLYRIFEGTDKFRLRLGMWIRDEQRMFYEVMPLAAERAGMTDTAWIAKASRENFSRYLATASERYKPEERAPVVELFSGWAVRVGGGELLATFAGGSEIKESRTITQRLKSVLRPTAQRLYASLHRG